MKSIIVEDKRPLIGTVSISGSKISSIYLIYASMFCNEDIILYNVPNIPYINDELEIIKSIGGTANWIGKNTLLLNGSTIDTYKIPFKNTKRLRTTFLITGVLLHRFGKAYIPKIDLNLNKPSPINRILETWDSLGVVYLEDENYYMLSNESLKPNLISFKNVTNLGSAHALILSSCLLGDSVIKNISQDPDVNDLILFLKHMGVGIINIEPSVIKVSGTNVFKKHNYEIKPDKTEVIMFSVATLMTNGNILIKNVVREDLTSFTYFLMKIGARFEFDNNGFKVWSLGEVYSCTDATISNFPGLLSDWQSFLTLLLCKCEGESHIYDLVYTNRFDYIKDLNRMGGKIDLIKPSQIGKEFLTYDDSFVNNGNEPCTVIKVLGPVKLKAEKIDIVDLRNAAVLLIASLSCDGKSFISGFEKVEFMYEDVVEKFKELGAKIKYVSSD